MKKLICLLLALTILFAAALAESGLKERRPALEEIPLDDALAATKAPPRKRMWKTSSGRSTIF